MLTCPTAARRLPYFRVRNLFPAERVIARPMRDEMVKPCDAFRHYGTVTDGNPPKDQRGLHWDKPFFAADIEALVQRLPDKALQGRHIFPDGQVRQEGRIVIDQDIHGV